MAKKTTTDTIADLQEQYDKLQKEATEKFGPRATAMMEKQFREELKKKLAGVGLDRDEFKRRKGEVARKLDAAKLLRREEIAAGVAAGTIDEDAGIKEIVALGWEINAARSDFATARSGAGPVEPKRIETNPPDEAPTRIVDPITSDRSDVQDVTYSGEQDKQPKPERVYVDGKPDKFKAPRKPGR